MQQNIRAIENIKPVWATAPASYSGTAMTAKWVNLAKYGRMAVLIQTGAWAGGTAAVTANQAKDVSGGSSKALGISFVWISGANPSDTYTKTTVNSNTFNLDTANLLYWVEFVASDLDVNNGFRTLTIAIASPGANADFYSVTYFGLFPRYPDTALPSTLVN